MRTLGKLVCTFSLLASILSCQTGGGGSVSGNEAGSAPSNENEATDYQRAVNRCHRTGGTRVVKIMGDLRCY